MGYIEMSFVFTMGLIESAPSCSILYYYYQILSIIFLKEFIKLNVNSDTMLKYVKLVELNISNVFVNTQTLKMIL